MAKINSTFNTKNDGRIVIQAETDKYFAAYFNHSQIEAVVVQSNWRPEFIGKTAIANFLDNQAPILTIDGLHIEISDCYSPFLSYPEAEDAF